METKRLVWLDGNSIVQIQHVEADRFDEFVGVLDAVGFKNLTPIFEELYAVINDAVEDTKS